MELPSHPQAPDLRWWRICRLIETGRRPRRSDDRWIRRGHRFLEIERMREADSGASPAPARDPFADIRAAYALHGRGDRDELRSSLDAALLTGTDLSVIAPVVRVPEPVVSAYAALFMNVRHMLDCPVFIASRFLEPGFGPIREPAAVRRTVGWCEGWEALRRFLDTGELSIEMRQRVEASSKGHRMMRVRRALDEIEADAGNAALLMRFVRSELRAAGRARAAAAGRRAESGNGRAAAYLPPDLSAAPARPAAPAAPPQAGELAA